VSSKKCVKQKIVFIWKLCQAKSMSRKKKIIYKNCVKQKACQGKRKLFIIVQGEMEKEKAKVKGKWK
jgi:hypothetical protein